ncbi:MAG: hypothetical protein ABH852_05585 [Methanobacteriota archaeon]
MTRTAEIPLTITRLMPPAAPELMSPDNGVTLDIDTPTFDWADVAGAKTYTLQLATDENFSRIELTKTTIESTATLSQSEALSYGTMYYWRVQGANAAGSGNWSLARALTAKLTAPKVTGFQTAEGAKYINSANIQLTISALNAARMSFSSDGIIWSDWEPYQTSKSYTLSAPDGLKNIYIRVRDTAGDIGQSAVASVIFDQTPPSTTHSLSGELGAEGYIGSAVVILSSMDSTSGVSLTNYRVDGGEWKTGDTFVLSGDGEHTVEYYSTDLAGNQETPKTLELTVYTPTIIPPFISQYWWAIIPAIVAAGVVTTFVVRRTKRAGKLERIKKEKAQLPKLKREAETKYFKDGSISRDTYDAMVKDYQRRKSELEKEERMLKAKAKPEVKGRKAKRGRKR